MDIVPPSEAHKIAPQNARHKIASTGYGLPGIKEALRSKDGEMLSRFEGYPVPRKGIIYFEAVRVNNHVKRLTLSTFHPFACKAMVLPAIGFILTPFKWKIEFLDRFLWNYIRQCNSLYDDADRCPILKYEYYNNCSKAIWSLTKVFLTELGIKEETADRVGEIFATLLEYDDYYKLMVEDPMSEMTLEEVKNPAKFVEKFIRIMNERSPDNKDTINKFNGFIKLLKFGFYLPRIKKAFIKAFNSINFKWLQLDDLEYFWQMNRGNYNVKGLTIEQRFPEYCRILRKHWQDTYPDSGVREEDEQPTAEAKLMGSPTFQRLSNSEPLNLNWDSLKTNA